jgi:hypothetical protein
MIGYIRRRDRRVPKTRGPPAFLKPHPRHFRRQHSALRGPHPSYADFPHNPNYWWPEDRAWCIVTDTDVDWAYVAGSAACIDEVLAVPATDAYATKPENPAHSGMDVLNDPGASIPRLPQYGTPMTLIGCTHLPPIGARSDETKKWPGIPGAV